MSGRTAPTLPDLLRPGLDVVFVGINPSVYSAERGHYFARPSNRFWPCLSRSKLSEPVRRALGVDRLLPEHDRALLEYGVGFTDVVKRATPKASDVSSREFVAAVGRLVSTFEKFAPRIACFHGVTGYRPVHQALAGTKTEIRLGLQSLHIGSTRLYVVPNPSGANAHFTREDQTVWYDRLADSIASWKT